MGENSHIRIYDRRKSVVFRMTSGDYGGLSNMAPNFPLMINGTKIATAEALYQACRYPNRSDIQAIIIDQPSPMTAKMKSKKYRGDTRPDWERKKLAIMRWCLHVKLAQNWSRFGALLEKTGDVPIVEESRKDAFWGAQPNDDGTLVGLNVLGRLLMKLREDYLGPDKDKLHYVAPLDIPDFLFLGRPVGQAEPPVHSNYVAPIQEFLLPR